MHGVLPLDKPPGVTSQAALDPVKRAIDKRTRVGHAGTLDPFATGLLLGLVGDATRLAEFGMALPKTYEATALFGERTDTLDPDGEIVERADPGPAAPPGLEAALARFRGEIEQVPPAWSALKVDGRRAYALARSGEAPELAPRPVAIHSICLGEVRWPEADFTVTCGAGTYVRSLARDLGEVVGLPARLAVLRRTVVGPFRADDGLVPREGISSPDVEAHLLPPIALVRSAGLTELAISDDLARLFVRGTAVTVPPPADRFAVLLEGTETVLGIGRGDGEGGTRPERVFAGARDEFLR